jgi:site-specific DNA-methyltransferase (adenine-specific)
MKFDLHHGDCLEVLRTMADNSADSIVTDPPYGLSFMGKKWDYDVPGVEVWAECLRVLKPGGHLLAFAGTRTQHRMAVRIEDAGFEIRDMIAWVYGSGFPKSLDVSKAIDKAAGAEREVVGPNPWNHVRNHSPEAWNGPTRTQDGKYGSTGSGHSDITAPATESAKQWEGWGTALKPALEPITMARKPLIGTVADNVPKHGTGGLNIDGCRVVMQPGDTKGEFGPRSVGLGENNTNGIYGGGFARQDADESKGRWPANLIHDGSDEVVGLFPETGASKAGVRDPNGSMGYHGGASGLPGVVSGHSDKGGSAARFFYCAKASKRDRDEGLEGFELKRGGSETFDPRTRDGVGAERQPTRANVHPTVKPTDLMRYLCRLVTPPGGVVLDPFMGSGSTGKAAMLEGFRFVGIEREAEYLAIARARIEAATTPEPKAEKPAAQTPKPKPATNGQNDLFSEAD